MTSVFSCIIVCGTIFFCRSSNGFSFDCFFLYLFAKVAFFSLLLTLAVYVVAVILLFFFLLYYIIFFLLNIFVAQLLFALSVLLLFRTSLSFNYIVSLMYVSTSYRNCVQIVCQWLAELSTNREFISRFE